jgi:hypothetical protein
VQLLEDQPEARVQAIAAATGFDENTVGGALLALEGAYVGELGKHWGHPGVFAVRSVTPAGRQAVGQWPTPESLADQLAAAFRTAAEAEPDEENQSRLRQVAGFLASAGRDIAVDVIGQVISHSTGMG